MLSESAWDRGGVRRQLIADANAHFGHACALVIDESAFAKKGDMCAGVARQWNARLGKTDNSQVGVFAAVARDGVCALVEGELYIPEEWFADPARCREAGIPEDVELRTKGEMALTMIHRLRREALRFAYTVFDAGYGHLPWLLRAVDGERESFLAQVHSDQAIYLADPAPAVPVRQATRGKAPSRLQAQAAPLTVTAWANTQPASRWRRVSVREGEKGEVLADYLKQRVWLWDGAEQRARCWHLLVRREIDGSKLKFCLSNAKPDASLRRLAQMQAARHFVERAFEDGRLWHGALSGPGLAGLASSHGTRHGGVDVPGQGAFGPPRDGAVAVLQRSGGDHAPQAAHQDRNRRRSRRRDRGQASTKARGYGSCVSKTGSHARRISVWVNLTK